MKARDNPFAVHRVLAFRYRPRGWTWDELMNRLAAMRYRAAIVGPQGTGKTTLLEDLAPRLMEKGFGIRALRLDRENRSFSREILRRLEAELTARDIVLLDGAEQLSMVKWWGFRRVVRRAGGLIITMHHPGRLPTLLQTSGEVEVLEQMVRELAGEGQIPAEQLRAILREQRGNVRNALRYLYDCYSRR